MSMTRRKFISLLGASLAVAKAGVCALPRLPQRESEFVFGMPDYKFIQYDSTITVGDLQKAYAAATFAGQPDALYWSHDADLDAWPKMNEVTDAEVVKRFTDTPC